MTVQGEEITCTFYFLQTSHHLFPMVGHYRDDMDALGLGDYITQPRVHLFDHPCTPNIMVQFKREYRV